MSISRYFLIVSVGVLGVGIGTNKAAKADVVVPEVLNPEVRIAANHQASKISYYSASQSEIRNPAISQQIKSEQLLIAGPLPLSNKLQKRKNNPETSSEPATLTQNTATEALESPRSPSEATEPQKPSQEALPAPESPSAQTSPETSPPPNPAENPPIESEGTAIDLNPNPNPLVLPTKPEEVQIKNIVPLTLQQSVELAQRNNRDLQVTRLERDRARAELDAAEAALFPTLSVAGNATRRLDAGGELGVQASKRQLESQIPVAQSTVTLTQDQINQNNIQSAETIALLQDQINNTTDPFERVLLQQQLALTQQTQQLTNAQLQQQLAGTQQNLQSTQKQISDLKNFANTSLDGAVSLRYAIFSAERQATINFAAESLRISDLQVRVQEEQLRLDTALAYYDLQQADAQVLINSKDVEVRSKELENTQLLMQAQLATSLDLLNARVELGNSIQNLRNSQAQQQTAQRNIAQLLSLSSSVTPIAADPVEVSGEWTLPLEDTIILALQNRVELEQLLAARRRGEAERSRALAGITPQVNLFADYSLLQLYSDDPSDFVSRGFADGYTFGLNVQWTFFDGGRAKAGARAADANIAIAEQQYANQGNQIRFQVEQAFFPLPTNLENVSTARQAVKDAEEAVRAAQLRFQASISTSTDVLLAQNRLVQAQNNLVNAVLNYNRSLAGLQRAVQQYYKIDTATQAK